MGRLLNRIGLPLLTKELIEQSARKRTWFLRSAYLGLLFLLFMTTASQYWDTNNFRSMLGTGGRLFDFLVGFQFFGIYVVVPLSAFGLITAEKERDSLQLLLLTRLTPTTILFEKLLSRMVPLALFLVASLPLLAVSYSYGGVSTPMLTNAVLCLVSTSFFLACIALLMSTIAASSTRAFFATLVGGAVMTIGPPILNEISDEVFRLELHDLPFIDREAVFLFMGPFVFYEDENKELYRCVLWNLPQLVSGLGCLAVARFALPRVSVSGKSSIARRIRTAMEGTVNAVIPGSTRVDLPDQNPITWIERRNGLLSRPLYLVILFVMVATFLFLGSWVAAAANDLDEFAAFCHGALWIIAPLMICGRASGLFGTERARQTLEVLLTTPLKTSEIIRQKMSGVWGLIGLLVILFLVVSIICAAASYTRGWKTQPIPLAVFSTILTAVIVLPMVAWLSIAISLHTKTAARATVYSVITLVVWCLGPGFCCVLCMIVSNGGGFGGSEEGFFAIVFPLLSPAFVPAMNVAAFFDDDPLEEMYIVSVIWNAMIYGGALGLLRWHCMEHGPEALDRLDNRIDL